MLQIRKASTGDIPLIQELTMEVWPQTYTPIVGEVQVAFMLQKFYSTEALQQQMEQGEQQFLICFSEEQPAAFASYSEVEPNIYKLHKLYIILSQQGKGIGKFIIDYICNLLKEKNASHLRLNVNRYNSAAIAFYEKYGLKRIADEDIPIGAGYYMNDHVLEITLN